MTSTAVHSKAVVLLLINKFVVAPNFCVCFICPCFVVECFVSFIVLVIISMHRQRTLIAILCVCVFLRLSVLCFHALITAGHRAKILHVPYVSS